MRHFIVGNGKSLLKTPLHLIKDEVSWGMNRIHLMYPHTVWRPTYYFSIDHSHWMPAGYWREMIRANTHAKHKWLWWQYRDGLQDRIVPFIDESDYVGVGDLPDTTWIKKCSAHHHVGFGKEESMWEWHYPYCTGLGGLTTVFQLAVQMGASEIYLLGCDLYENYKDYNDNYFDPEYTDFHPRPDRAEYETNLNLQLHEVAKESCPVPIYNATYGGNLEVHPRVELREIL